MSRNNPVFRAGMIPYIRTDDAQIKFMFMRPSNIKYGGPDWQIAKGRMEDTDADHLATALREGSEELGLKIDNIRSITRLGSFLGRTEIFVCEIINICDFDQFHFETGATTWLSLSEFNDIGREIHKPIISIAYSTINSLRT